MPFLRNNPLLGPRFTKSSISCVSVERHIQPLYSVFLRPLYRKVLDLSKEDYPL